MGNFVPMLLRHGLSSRMGGNLFVLHLLGSFSRSLEVDLLYKGVHALASRLLNSPAPPHKKAPPLALSKAASAECVCFYNNVLSEGSTHVLIAGSNDFRN